MNLKTFNRRRGWQKWLDQSRESLRRMEQSARVNGFENHTKISIDCYKKTIKKLEDELK